MTRSTGRRDPTGEYVVSAIGRKDAAEHLRDLLRSLQPSDAQIIAARYMGIPGKVVASGFRTSVHSIDGIENRVAGEWGAQPSIFTNSDAIQNLKDSGETKIRGVLDEFLLDESLPATARIKDYLRQREPGCKVCGRPVRCWPIAVDDTVQASRRKGKRSVNGRPRDYCSKACRQKAYRERRRADGGEDTAIRR